MKTRRRRTARRTSPALRLAAEVLEVRSLLTTYTPIVTATPSDIYMIGNYTNGGSVGKL